MENHIDKIEINQVHDNTQFKYKNDEINLKEIKLDTNKPTKPVRVRRDDETVSTKQTKDHHKSKRDRHHSKGNWRYFLKSSLSRKSKIEPDKNKRDFKEKLKRYEERNINNDESYDIEKELEVYKKKSEDYIRMAKLNSKTSKRRNLLIGNAEKKPLALQN